LPVAWIDAPSSVMKRIAAGMNCRRAICTAVWASMWMCFEYCSR
jgi:hypothetical protein